MSIISECRAEPPVAASSTGVPAMSPSSVRSQKDLNSPVYPALKVGVTAITASAARTASSARASFPEGNPMVR